MLPPVIDLHCDLLFYLELDPKRTPYDLEARTAIPQFRKGNVKLQTMAIFTQTGSQSKEIGLKQAHIYQELPLRYPQEFEHFSPKWSLSSPRIGTLLAFENASGFCDEKEPLQKGLERLNQILEKTKLLYISLTWNSENRFGGGALAQAGLKEDGKTLLEALDRRQIAIDLSHASDALAYEIIDYMEGRGLKIPLMASHSNSRAITSVPRNLPDEIARELIRRGGVIGLNLYTKFIGETKEDVVKHIAHWLELGGEDAIAIGADFFNEKDLPLDLRNGTEAFFKEFQDASNYPTLLSFVQNELKLKPSIIEKLANHNALAFIRKLTTQELAKHPS